MTESFNNWLDVQMRQGSRDVPARLIVVLATLERLCDTPSLLEDAHLSQSRQQLKLHDRYVKRALDRFKLDAPRKTGGRRAANLLAWLPKLFEWLRERSFPALNDEQRSELLTELQEIVAARIRSVNEEKPINARLSLGTARAILSDLLDQAQRKKRAKDVAEYLVGAKLQLVFGDDAVVPKDVNTPSQPADFCVGDAAIEVTINQPDLRHIEQIRSVLTDTALQFWLVVRLADREKWQNATDASLDEALIGRLVVTDIETFLCQNISERGRFQGPDVLASLGELFDKYNHHWVPEAGGSAIRIVLPHKA